MTDKIRWDRIAAALLRQVPPAVAADFFASPEWAEVPQEDKEAIYIADAELEEAERAARQRARQLQAEDDYRRRMGAGGEDKTYR